MHRSPRRFRGDPEWAERFAGPLLRLAGEGARMSADELDALGRSLNRGDEPADALVRAIRDDHAVTMPQVRAAMAHDIDAVPDAAPALREFFAHLENRPGWVDDALLERGTAACRRVGGDAVDILAYGSLLGGYRSGAPLEPLMRTGRIAGTNALARIGETSQWWLACTSPGGMRRDGEGWRLSVHVRVMHAFINYQLERESDWDHGLRGTPINQYDRAGTLGSFSTSFLLQARALGVRITREDSAAIMHLWSYVGWLMGVDEEYLPRTERIGRRILGNLVATFSGPDESSRILGGSLIDMYDQAPGISRWRRAYQRERALSMATFLNLGHGMADVGQPIRPPWLPMLRIASNLFWTHGVGRMPGGQRVLDRRGERAFVSQARWQFGGSRPPIAPLPG